MSIKPSKQLMLGAIQVAELNKTPFGAVLAMGEEVFATAANQTKKKNDPTAHAEIEVIRKLCDQLQKNDLSGFTLYSTCEPCPMCMSAVIWSGIETVVYGCDIPTISNYMKQIEIRVDEIIKKSSSDVDIKPDFMSAECEDLLIKFS